MVIYCFLEVVCLQIQLQRHFELDPGCYKFQILDSGEDGLSFWANNDGDVMLG